MSYTLENKRVLVVGMVRSGIAAARLLAARGALPILNDLKPREALKGLEVLEGLGCDWQLGQTPDALLEACDLVVISPGVPIQSPWIERARAMGRTVIGELELGAAFVDGTLIAITGTNGKTTTTTLVGEMMKNAGRSTHVAGNIGDPFTSAVLEGRPGDTYVIEVSSFQMETAAQFHPQVGALLNLKPDHLNRHGDMETYVAMKMRMFERQTERDTAVYNADDPACVRECAPLKARKLAFSRLSPVEEGAFVRAGEIVLRVDGQERALCGVGDVRIPGLHNLENALAATCMAAVCAVPAPVIRHTLRSFAGGAHRTEAIRTLNGVTYINDSKGTNVDSTLAAIAAMAAPTVIILGGDDKEVGFASLAEAIVRKGCITDAVLIGKTAGKLRAALEAAGFAACHDAGYDFEKAVRMAASLARPGGNVLLSPACASFDMFNDYEHRGEEFLRLVQALT